MTIALILAGISQLMNLIDPVIFGKIIDDYALNPGNLLRGGSCQWGTLLAGVGDRCRIVRPSGKSVPGLFHTAGSAEVRYADIQ